MTVRPASWVYLVSDRRRLRPSARTTAEQLAALEAQLEEAMAAGVDVIQIREGDLDAAELQIFAGRLMSRAAGTGTRILINDRADVARSAGADGVHLRADGPPVARVRSFLAPQALVGRSVHSVEEVREHDDADYLLYGAIFPTESKPGASAAGLDALRHASRASRVPVVAIGGIDAARAEACVDAGARGLAAIGMFLPEGQSRTAVGPSRAVAILRAALKRRLDA